MSFLVYDTEQNEVKASYSNRQDADSVCDAFNTINEVNRHISNIPSPLIRRYVVINNGNTSPNISIGLPPTISISTNALGGSVNNWLNYVGNNIGNNAHPPY
jgi:hypothetical protein